MKRLIGAVLGGGLLLALPGASLYAKTTTTSKEAKATHQRLERWPAANLSGIVAAVYPDKRLVIVKDSSGTPFDLIVTRGTRIKSGAESIKLPDLASLKNDKVAVKLLPERKGDIAESINVTK